MKRLTGPRPSLADMDRELGRRPARGEARARALCSLRRLEDATRGRRQRETSHARGHVRVRVFDYGEALGQPSAVQAPDWTPVPREVPHQTIAMSASGRSAWNPVRATSGTADVEPFEVEAFGPPPSPSEHKRLDIVSPPPRGEPFGAASVPSPKEIDQDIEAVTGHAMTAAEPVDFRTQTRQRMPLSDGQEVEDVEAQPAPSVEQSGTKPHSIFDRMAENLRYASTFDLGTIELERRFDAFERELDLAEAREADVEPRLDLEDGELVEDLAYVMGTITASEPGEAGRSTKRPNADVPAGPLAPDEGSSSGPPGTLLPSKSTLADSEPEHPVPDRNEGPASEEPSDEAASDTTAGRGSAVPEPALEADAAVGKPALTSSPPGHPGPVEEPPAGSEPPIAARPEAPSAGANDAQPPAGVVASPEVAEQPNEPEQEQLPPASPTDS